MNVLKKHEWTTAWDDNLGSVSSLVESLMNEEK